MAYKFSEEVFTSINLSVLITLLPSYELIKEGESQRTLVKKKNTNNIRGFSTFIVWLEII